MAIDVAFVLSVVSEVCPDKFTSGSSPQPKAYCLLLSAVFTSGTLFYPQRRTGPRPRRRPQKLKTTIDFGRPPVKKQIGFGWTPYRPRMDPVSTSDGPRIDLGWSPYRPRMDPVSTSDGPRIDLRWTPYRLRMDPVSTSEGSV